MARGGADDGKRVEGFSLAQARVVVQEGAPLGDTGGVSRGVDARRVDPHAPPLCKSALFFRCFPRFVICADLHVFYRVI